ncbi:hypothetical protein [Rossellomorea sp. DUT-2]|uniref:hypothetical protein n=1 Tax=Rossellomorea sp. DUT-2 TaxID=3412021 RepID=UPI003D186604
MKKRWIAVVLLVVVAVVGGTYFWIRENPPMEVGVIGQNVDGTSVLVEVTNHGFSDAKVVGVTVNNDEAPEKVKMQVSNLIQGYFITDDDDQDELPKEISFKNIEDVSVKAVPSKEEQYKKLEDGTATKDDTIHAVNVFHDEEVNRVMIEYRYFGMTFHETVEVPF